VLTSDDSFTCHPDVYPQWNDPYVPLHPSHTVSLHFGWYSFPIPLMVGDWVGRGKLVKYRGGFPAQRRSPIPVLAAVAKNQTGWSRGTTVEHWSLASELS